MALSFANRYEPDRGRELYRAYLEMARYVRDCYHSLSDEERAKLSFSGEMERELFRQIIALDENDSMRETVRSQQNELNDLRESFIELQRETGNLRREAQDLREEITGIRRSWTYRLGRIATWLPRKLRGGVRCWRENGMRYTVRRLFEHLTGRAGKKG